MSMADMMPDSITKSPSSLFRLLRHELRHHYHKFFVPFYVGLDISRYHWGYNKLLRDVVLLELVDWLAKRPEWSVMGGKDHFLVAGRITWEFRRLSESDSDWGNKILFLPAAKNMSMLVVESSPWNANAFGILYLTYFHPTKDADVFSRQDIMRKLDWPFPCLQWC